MIHMISRKQISMVLTFSFDVYTSVSLRDSGIFHQNLWCFVFGLYWKRQVSSLNTVSSKRWEFFQQTCWAFAANFLLLVFVLCWNFSVFWHRLSSSSLLWSKLLVSLFMFRAFSLWTVNQWSFFTISVLFFKLGGWIFLLSVTSVFLIEISPH